MQCKHRLVSRCTKACRRFSDATRCCEEVRQGSIAHTTTGSLFFGGEFLSASCHEVSLYTSNHPNRGCLLTCAFSGTTGLSVAVLSTAARELPVPLFCLKYTVLSSKFGAKRVSSLKYNMLTVQLKHSGLLRTCTLCLQSSS